MTTKQFKRIEKILQQVYIELEAEALKQGLGLDSAKYDLMLENAQKQVLKKFGFTVEEYNEIKAKVDAFTSEELMTEVEEVKRLLREVGSRRIPTEEEIAKIATKIAKKYVVEPKVINKIVKEVQIQTPPQLVTETIREEYDDAWVRAELGYFADKLNNLEIPEGTDVEKLKEEMRNEFAEQFEHNINTLGMPDFRKLAMGLQAQIDTLGTAGDPVTLAGEDYLSLSGQAITANPIDLDNLSATGTPSASTFLRGDNTWATPAGTGDVVGPASSTDNAIARFDSTTGKIIQNSVVTVADTTGVIAGTQGLTLSGTTSGTTALVATAVAGTTTITFPATTGTVALTSDLSSYLPLAGGIMTGDILMTSNKIIGGSTTTSDLTLQTTTGVGTTGADMHFLVGNNGATEAMTILNSGNVGIGTSTPSGKLHVVTTGSGNVNFDQADSNTSIGFLNGFTLNNTDATTNNYIGILFGDNTASAGGASGGIGMQLTDRTNHYGDLVAVTRSAGGYTEKMRITSGGNMGLGTATPTQAKLNIVSGSAATPVLYLTDVTTNTTNKTPTIVSLPYLSAGANPMMLWASNISGANRIIYGGGSSSYAAVNSHMFYSQAGVGTSAGTLRATIDDNGLALGTNSLTLTGSIAATGARVTKGWFTDIESTNMPTVGGTAILTSLTAPQFTTIELGHATDTTIARVSAGVISVEGVTVPTISSTNTFTNKRVTPRVSSETSSATPTINTDNVDAHSITALAADITSMTTNLSGTPTNFQKLIIRFKDNGTARAITWGASFEDAGQALPTTTVISKLLTVGFIYNTVTSKWGCVAVANET